MAVPVPRRHKSEAALKPRQFQALCHDTENSSPFEEWSIADNGPRYPDNLIIEIPFFAPVANWQSSKWKQSMRKEHTHNKQRILVLSKLEQLEHLSLDI